MVDKSCNFGLWFVHLDTNEFVDIVFVGLHVSLHLRYAVFSDMF